MTRVLRCQTGVPIPDPKVPGPAVYRDTFREADGYELRLDDDGSLRVRGAHCEIVTSSAWHELAPPEPAREEPAQVTVKAKRPTKDKP